MFNKKDKSEGEIYQKKEKTVREEIEDAIDQKKEELIEEFKQVTLKTAITELEMYARHLKVAYTSQIFSPEHLLDILKKGGFVTRAEVDIDKIHKVPMRLGDLLRHVVGSELLEKSFSGKYEITVVIENKQKTEGEN